MARTAQRSVIVPEVIPTARDTTQVGSAKEADKALISARRVPFHRTSLGPEEEHEILDTLRSGWLTTGPKTRRFEQMFAEYTGAKHAIGVNSCTAALHLSLVAHGVGPGDEVITSPITFAATANVVEHVGAKPVFVDVLPDTLNMDPSRLAPAMTPRTKAIIAVHFAGHPCDLDAVSELASQQGVPVIEDAAHAIESVYRGRKIGGEGRAACFSFYATKNITTGEGGMITTNDDELADRLRLLSMHGISVEAWRRHGPGLYRHWDIVEPGFKYNMFDIQAGLGIRQLPRIESMRRLRRKWTEMYDDAFAADPEIVVLRRQADVECAYHLYVVRLRTENLRASHDELLAHLQERGIGIGIHFRPVHLHPYYRRKYGYAPGTFPVAEYAGERVVSLPLFPTMTEQDVGYVAEATLDLMRTLRK